MISHRRLGRSTVAVSILLFLFAAALVVAQSTDSDGDSVPDSFDNCPFVPNPDQADEDADGFGDACDPCLADPLNLCGGCDDADGDAVCDAVDNCPLVYNPDQGDLDSDGIGDLCDPCPTDPSPDCQLCNDVDGDGLCDLDDNCPFVPNPGQEDFDLDGRGDLCDRCPVDPLDLCPACVALPQWATAWWPGDGSAEDRVGPHTPSGTIGAPQFVPAQVREGMRFVGHDGYLVADNVGLDLSQYASRVFVAWIRVDSISTAGEDAIVDKRGGSPAAWSGYVWSVAAVPQEPGRFVVRFRLGDGVTTQQVASAPLELGRFHHVAVAVDAVGATLSLDVAGQAEVVVSRVVVGGANAEPLTIGHPSTAVADGLGALDGVIDELHFFGSPISRCAIEAMRAAGADGVCRDDADGDGHLDHDDNCPTLWNPGQANSDVDRAGDACDCRPNDEEAARPPKATGGVRLGADLVRRRLGWCSQFDDAGQGVRYNVVRGRIGQWPVGAGTDESCLAAALWDVRWDDDADPAQGEGYWYLTRATNACGAGSYGFDSAGEPRSGETIDTCPVTEEDVCWATGGWWDLGSCGHWECGLPPDCDAIIPGCVCGAGRSFADGTGCFDDPACG